jgi:hypothetical protein
MPEEKKQKLSDDNIVPITVGNPSKAASLAIDQSHLDEYFGGQETESSVIQCVKPPKGVYFTVMPEPTKPWVNRGFYWILELEGRDPYFVTPDIAKIKADEDVLRPILLVRYVTMPGIEGLWPIKINPPDGRANLWNASARNIMELAANGTPKEPGQKWVRLKSGKGHYGYQVSPKTIENTPPQFSSRTFLELVDIASEGRVVDSLTHEVWTVLAEGER